MFTFSLNGMMKNN